jgi:putative membrane protein
MISGNGFVKYVVVISVAVPLLVAVLMFLPLNLGFTGTWIKNLPTLNAILNSTTAICLVLALVFIRQMNIKMHRVFMSVGFLLGSLFLISYIIYHSNATTVIYGDSNHDGVLDADELLAVGMLRSFYVFTLLSHIVLSMVVVPFVLMAFYFALSDQVNKHKNIVKYTFPIWLYVSVTGVIVYFMISPYYV